MKRFFWILLIIIVLVGLYGTLKPIPDGVNFAGTKYNVSPSSIQFFSDVTYIDTEGIRYSEQQIFDEVFRMIDDARSYILLDFFLFNDYIGTATTSFRKLSQELTDKLVEKKKLNPETKIQLITDPVNEFYGGLQFDQFVLLEESGVEVITTELKSLRDSNPLYSSVWRTFIQWFGNNKREGLFPNVLDSRGQKLSLRSYLSLFNYKANHRKVIMADYIRGSKKGFSVLVTSANPHDGSSAHSNSAVRIDDFVWRDVLTTERAVAEFSGRTFMDPSADFISDVAGTEGDVVVQLITERAIRDAVVSSINNLEKNDTLDMAMFYIADRKIIKALKKADDRGVMIRLLLDPNKDAFGRVKSGMPNRQVANELYNNTDGNTEIKWCYTHGEQCHSKLLLLKSNEGFEMIIGSANFTKRNVGGLNLETDIYISSDEPFDAINDAYSFFNRTWGNKDGFKYSVEYNSYRDDSVIKKIHYRVKEFLGTNRW